MEHSFLVCKLTQKAFFSICMKQSIYSKKASKNVCGLAVINFKSMVMQITMFHAFLSTDDVVWIERIPVLRSAEGSFRNMKLEIQKTCLHFSCVNTKTKIQDTALEMTRCRNDNLSCCDYLVFCICCTTTKTNKKCTNVTRPSGNNLRETNGKHVAKI